MRKPLWHLRRVFVRKLQLLSIRCRMMTQRNFWNRCLMAHAVYRQNYVGGQ
jgi:hypothetical protein